VGLIGELSLPFFTRRFFPVVHTPIRPSGRSGRTI